MLRTSMSVMPKRWRMSNTGVGELRNPLTWWTGRSGTDDAENGITDDAWLCTIACTSGRRR